MAEDLQKLKPVFLHLKSLKIKKMIFYELSI